MGLLKALCGACIAEVGGHVAELRGGAYLVGRLFVGGIVRPIIIDRIGKCGNDHMLAAVEALEQYAGRCTGVLGVGNDPERICAEELLKRLARYIGHRFRSVGYEGLLKAGEDELIILAELLEHRHILIRVLEDYLRRIMIEQCIAGLGDGGRIVLVEVIHREATSEVGIADEGGVDKLHPDIAFAVLLVIRKAVGVLSGIDPVAVMLTEHGIRVVCGPHLGEGIGAVLAAELPDVPVAGRAELLGLERGKLVIGDLCDIRALDNGHGRCLAVLGGCGCKVACVVMLGVAVCVLCYVVHRAVFRVPCVAIGHEAGVVLCKGTAVCIGVRHAAVYRAAAFDIDRKACGACARYSADCGAVLHSADDIDRKACGAAVCGAYLEGVERACQICRRKVTLCMVGGAY